jgi:osmotically-inducible protein OsmY
MHPIEIGMKTDLQLRRDVMLELKWDPSFDAAAIAVDVDQGTVTLEGPVDSFADRTSIAHAAQRVAGVRGVTANISVALPESSKRSDTDITRAARNALHWNSAVPPHRVAVTVERGWITLSGAVDWEFQRFAAEAAMHHLTGITGVTVDIDVMPAAAPRDLQSTIEAALRRQSHAAAALIAVSIHDTEVTLSGSVHSCSERDSAITSAWRAAGVRSVVDRLLVGS